MKVEPLATAPVPNLPFHIPAPFAQRIRPDLCAAKGSRMPLSARSTPSAFRTMVLPALPSAIQLIV
jgi:hypothetical protein